DILEVDRLGGDVRGEDVPELAPGEPSIFVRPELTARRVSNEDDLPAPLLDLLDRRLDPRHVLEPLLRGDRGQLRELVLLVVDPNCPLLGEIRLRIVGAPRAIGMRNEVVGLWS